jgi:hypothetical protein
MGNPLFYHAARSLHVAHHISEQSIAATPTEPWNPVRIQAYGALTADLHTTVSPLNTSEAFSQHGFARAHQGTGSHTIAALHNSYYIRRMYKLELPYKLPA